MGKLANIWKCAENVLKRSEVVWGGKRFVPGQTCCVSHRAARLVVAENFVGIEKYQASKRI